MTPAWRDILFATGSWVAVGSLIPTLISDKKPPKATSLPTAAILAVYAGMYLDMGLVGAFASTLVLAILWMTLFLQTIGPPTRGA